MACLLAVSWSTITPQDCNELSLSECWLHSNWTGILYVTGMPITGDAKGYKASLEEVAGEYVDSLSNIKRVLLFAGRKTWICQIRETCMCLSLSTHQGAAPLSEWRLTCLIELTQIGNTRSIWAFSMLWSWLHLRGISILMPEVQLLTVGWWTTSRRWGELESRNQD